MSGFIAKAVGLRTCMLTGCTIFCIGTATTYWTLDSNVTYDNNNEEQIKVSIKQKFFIPNILRESPKNTKS